MSSLVQNDLTRASTFFALAFGLTALGGFAIGDLRLGVEYGLALGVGFAVFAYFFVAPTALDDGESDPDADPDADVESEPDGDGKSAEGSRPGAEE